MASGLLMLLDDISSILDDVATLTKVAAQKTSGVLGDDLALNAQQVSGVQANRELPIVWKVALGSGVNKLILVPGALILSIFLPWSIDPLMIIGGSFLCFEGVEKILHKFLHSEAEDSAHLEAHKEVIASEDIDPAEAESDKIRGAIRTDFILSAEIIVISLDVVTGSSMLVKVFVLSLIGLLMTVGVYGIVAAIVKLDDLGGWLARSKGLMRSVGLGILASAPYLMKFLSIAGTVAMFLVGGGILVHKIPVLHHIVESIVHPAENIAAWLKTPTSMAMESLLGVVAGALVVAMVQAVRWVFAGKRKVVS